MFHKAEQTRSDSWEAAVDSVLDVDKTSQLVDYLIEDPKIAIIEMVAEDPEIVAYLTTLALMEILHRITAKSVSENN